MIRQLECLKDHCLLADSKSGMMSRWVLTRPNSNIEKSSRKKIPELLDRSQKGDGMGFLSHCSGNSGKTLGHTGCSGWAVTWLNVCMNRSRGDSRKPIILAYSPFTKLTLRSETTCSERTIIAETGIYNYALKSEDTCCLGLSL